MIPAEGRADLMLRPSFEQEDIRHHGAAADDTALARLLDGVDAGQRLHRVNEVIRSLSLPVAYVLLSVHNPSV